MFRDRVEPLCSYLHGNSENQPMSFSLSVPSVFVEIDKKRVCGIEEGLELILVF